MRLVSSLATALFLLPVGSGAALADGGRRPGDLDLHFGSGGFATPPVANNSVGNAVAVQPDGRVLCAGTIGAGPNLLFARFLPDGSPDPSFGQNGRVILSVPGGSDHVLL